MNSKAVQKRIFNCADVNLVASEWGSIESPPIMLLHGAGQTRHTWSTLARTLADKGYYVLSLDLRGHGDSDWSPTQDYSSNAFIQDIKTVAAGLKQLPIIVGASLGGLMSLLTIGENCHQQIAKALVLVDITPNIDQAGKARIIQFMQSNDAGFANTDEAADSISAYLPHRPRPKSSKGLIRNLRKHENGRYYWHWDPAFFTGPNATHNDLDSRNVAAAKKVNIPTLLLRGQHSELVSEAAVKSLLNFIPNAEYVDISNAHHMIVGDNNDAFSAAVTQFIDTLH
jgi:non-heme chloroperoxidase